MKKKTIFEEENETMHFNLFFDGVAKGELLTFKTACNMVL